MALLQVAQNEGLVPTDEEITKNLQERADRTKKTLEEVKANANIPAMQRSEAIRRAAEAAAMLLSDGLDKAASKYNGK